MQKTEHYNLTQWEKTDRIQMEDFNDNNDKIDAAIAAAATAGLKIATGSYKGKGTSGSSNPNTLTLPFQPKILFVANSANGFVSKDGAIGVLYGASSVDFYASFTSNSNVSGRLFFTWSGNTVSWYTTATSNGAPCQLNSSSVTYHYFAIG